MAYQTIVSRLYGRSGYYQSGGAYGFRDQLQDTLGLKYIDTNFMKNQIIKHSKHQFIEGDVEHWWHDETTRGIRTRFSDDRLWLVYLVEDYIAFTGDDTILDIETPYRVGNPLEEGIEEKSSALPDGTGHRGVQKPYRRARYPQIGKPRGGTFAASFLRQAPNIIVKNRKRKNI